MLAPHGGGPVKRNRIAPLHPDGTPHTPFNPKANSYVFNAALQGDGKILVAGGFFNIAGQGRVRIARLNPDGTLDPTFNAGVNNGDIYALAVQPDGKILVGGAFATMGGQPRSCIARLNPATG